MAPLRVLAPLAAGCAALAAAQERPPPVFPPAWSITFAETTSIIIASYNTTGTWYYDYSDASAPRQRIDRANGKNDRYCGTVVTEDAPCSHVVVKSERYLVWPTLSKCCGCCNATVGCGVVRPTWMRDANGTWAGTAPFNGAPVWSGSADSWEITGLQPNYWCVWWTGGRGRAACCSCAGWPSWGRASRRTSARRTRAGSSEQP